MGIVAALFGLVLVLFVLWDTFETIIMPRTVTRRFGLTSLFNAITWSIVRPFVRATCRGNARREAILGVFGPLSLLALMALWALFLILGFSLLGYGLNVPLHGEATPGLGSYAYLSAVTFFTLGYGDLTAVNGTGRTLSVVEAGIGFGFLAIVISYIPVLYQAFSRREASALLLDSRAGSPPTAGEFLRRCGVSSGRSDLERMLIEFERWSAQLLETYLSYPVLSLYRSQHEMLGWLSCLTCILDACAMIQSCWDVRDDRDRELIHQAEHTFAMGRHLAVDLAYMLAAAPVDEGEPRLTSAQFGGLVRGLAASGVPLITSPEHEAKFNSTRESYEPYVVGLAQCLLLNLPAWMPEAGALDSWQTTAWDEAKHF